MRIAVHGKNFSDPIGLLVQLALETIKKNSEEVLISAPFANIIHEKGLDFEGFGEYTPGQNLNGVDALITLGGDGTLLTAVTHVGRSHIPILGINTGTMGFLATTAKENISQSLGHLFKGNYTFDDRAMLSLKTNKELFDNKSFALNDFTIVKKDSSSMIVVNTYINGEFLNAYWADGLIVATPTGSTGYSLSCGGPLILPQSKNFVITPVSPHNLTARPMVVNDDCEISFKIAGRNKNFLVSLDSRIETIDDSFELSIVKEHFPTRLIKLPEYDMFDTLRQKLNWGLDIRN